MSSSRSNIGTYLLESLHRRGARHIFGIPGDFALNFFQCIEKYQKLKLITLSHEPGLGFAADGMSRITQRLTPVAITYGAGALNIVNPVACAYAEKSPIVVISGAPGMNERGKGIHFHHQAKSLQSQRNVFKEITAYQAILEDPTTAANEIEKALTISEKLSLPVYIEIPRDRALQQCPPPHPKPLKFLEEDLEATEEAVAEIIERLSQAKRPVIMVDVEVKRFGLSRKVVQLAEKLQAPVVSSFMGRATYPINHPLFAGTYLGPAGDPKVMQLVENSDCLLLLGVIFADTNMALRLSHLNPKNLIHAISRHVTIGHHDYEHVTLETLLTKLISKMTRKTKKLGFQKKQPPPPKPISYFDDSPIKVETMIHAINRLFSEKGTMPVIADNGDCLFASLDVHTETLLASGYYATMGFAVPAGLGVQIGSGKRPLIMVGDGAFQMTGSEISHAPTWKANPIIIVFNNASWEMLRTIQPTGKYFGLSEWNYAKLASLWGGKGYEVRTKKEMWKNLLAAYQQKQFTILDVHLPIGETSKVLKKYLGKIRE